MKNAPTMKGLLAGIALCLLAHGTLAQGSLKKLDGRNGFKGFILGDSVKNYDAGLCVDRACYKLCSFLGEVGDIGTAKILTINLRVYKERVMGISAFFKRSDATEIKKVLEAAYGSPGKEVQTTGFDTYNWRSSNVDMFLDCPSNDEMGMLSLTSISLEKQLENCKEQEAARKNELEKERVSRAVSDL